MRASPSATDAPRVFLDRLALAGYRSVLAPMVLPEGCWRDMGGVRRHRLVEFPDRLGKRWALLPSLFDGLRWRLTQAGGGSHALPLRMAALATITRYHAEESLRISEAPRLGWALQGHLGLFALAEPLFWAVKLLATDTIGAYRVAFFPGAISAALREKPRTVTTGSAAAASDFVFTAMELRHFGRRSPDEVLAALRSRGNGEAPATPHAGWAEDWAALRALSCPWSALSERLAERFGVVLDACVAQAVAAIGAAAGIPDEHLEFCGALGDEALGAEDLRVVVRRVDGRVDEPLIEGGSFAVGDHGRCCGLEADLGALDAAWTGAEGAPRLEESPFTEAPVVVVIGVAEEDRGAALDLVAALTDAGVSAVADPLARSLKTAISAAVHAGAARVAIIGETERRDRAVVVKDLATRRQETLPLAELPERARAWVAQAARL